MKATLKKKINYLSLKMNKWMIWQKVYPVFAEDLLILELIGEEYLGEKDRKIENQGQSYDRV